MSQFFKFLMVVVVATVTSLTSIEAVLTFAPQPLALRAAKAETTMPQQLGGGTAAPGAAAIPKAADGHFWANGAVNGANNVRFLVDTGATAVALTPADAQRLGFKPSDLNYGYHVVTAAGQARAASVKLASLTVAGARIENVDALVIEKGLDTSLLGMTYLGRLASFQATRQAMILQP